LFIPPSRLDKRWPEPGRRVALISQSGAFIASRMSNLETLDPAFALSLGNQIDITIADLVAAVGRRDDVDVVGVYAEGFNDLDGEELLRHLTTLREAGRDVVFYKAGRTEPGVSAAAGHTAAVAGDYEVCQAAAAQAGALVTDTFKEFEQLLELATALHSKKVGGVRIGALSNAGFETVGMADAIRGQRYEIEMAELSPESAARLAAVLSKHGLERLVNARNPLDVTPMASEEVYEEAIRVLLASDEVDAVVVGIVPLTSALRTVPEELEGEGSLAERLPRVFAESEKPMIAVVDSGARYVPLVQALRRGGLPVFPSADQAIRSLGRYLCHRVATKSTRVA
jgi:acyl-CoA synthetase (NDP forming)